MPGIGGERCFTLVQGGKFQQVTSWQSVLLRIQLGAQQTITDFFLERVVHVVHEQTALTHEDHQYKKDKTVLFMHYLAGLEKRNVII